VRDKIFHNLFVLEMANNHWGDLDRGLNIIREYGAIVRYNNVKAAIKLQIRDVDSFIHAEFRGNGDLRYISKTEATRLSYEQYAVLVNAVKNVSCIPAATPFDEKSVDMCVRLGLPLLKIASSDVNDWPLIEKIASTKLPVIISTGGASEKDLDDVVRYFENRNIPTAINHCVSLYPSENDQLELNQIDWLRERHPGHVIGFSTHEYRDWEASMHISYAKGARTWERHIDIPYEDGKTVSPYCSLPEQTDRWFKAWHTAREMCGGSGAERRICTRREIAYLDELVRGIHARRDIEAGYVFSNDTFASDFYLAVPLRKGQLSCREIINGETLVQPIRADEALTLDHIDGPCSRNPALRTLITERGL
jgi:N-acetylneuraminate synthase